MSIFQIRKSITLYIAYDKAWPMLQGSKKLQGWTTIQKTMTKLNAYKAAPDTAARTIKYHFS